MMTARRRRRIPAPLHGTAAALTLIVAHPALFPDVAGAHHGVASLGVVGVQGPGAPVEISNASVLPQGSVVLTTKLDYASFELLTPERDAETDLNVYWMHGLGYGITRYLSVFAFLPYTTKRVENLSLSTSGFADPSLLAVVGVKWDEGLRWTPAQESLDELEDLHMTFAGGLTLPTGNADLRDAEGTIDPGMSLGFGSPSFTGSVSASKQIARHATLCGEASIIRFTEYEYADGVRGRFGREFRLGGALAYRAFANPEKRLRVDMILEGNLLALGRDQTDGEDEAATGGVILYATPGARLSLGSASVSAGVKLPAWKDLNEEEDQQGAEGKESHRLIVTVSSSL